MNGWRLAFNGGMGDAFVLDSLLTSEARAALRVIYWGHPNRISLQPLLKASRTYQHVEHHDEVAGRNQEVYRWMLDDFVTTTATYNRSSFLTDTVSDVRFYDAPFTYIVIQPSTPANCPSQQVVRNLDAEEWDAVIARLDARDEYGLVLNGPDADRAPSYYRLRDLQGQTTLNQSIEILKKASGFVGIASCLAVLAAQLFSSEDLLIKGPEENVKRLKHRYFAPHTDFGFLVDRIEYGTI